MDQSGRAHDDPALRFSSFVSTRTDKPRSSRQDIYQRKAWAAG
jgi:hypothetical protein